MSNKDDSLINQLYYKQILSPKIKDLYLKEQHEPARRFWNSDNEDSSNYNVGPVYHGGGWNGISMPLIRDGSFGTGIYFTSSKARALSYTESDWKEIQGAKAGKRQHLIEARLRLPNPVVVEKGARWPEFAALVQLGMNPERAKNAIYRAQERTGNTGSVIRKQGESKGYDGLIIHHDDESEYVVWQSYNVMVVDVEVL
jgi:hypothetical protein